MILPETGIIQTSQPQTKVVTKNKKGVTFNLSNNVIYEILKYEDENYKPAYKEKHSKKQKKQQDKITNNEKPPEDNLSDVSSSENQTIQKNDDDEFFYSIIQWKALSEARRLLYSSPIISSTDDDINNKQITKKKTLTSQKPPKYEEHSILDLIQQFSDDDEQDEIPFQDFEIYNDSPNFFLRDQQSLSEFENIRKKVKIDAFDDVETQDLLNTTNNDIVLSENINLNLNDDNAREDKSNNEDQNQNFNLLDELVSKDEICNQKNEE